jgi:hypothetical protein
MLKVDIFRIAKSIFSAGYGMILKMVMNARLKNL